MAEHGFEVGEAVHDVIALVLDFEGVLEDLVYVELVEVGGLDGGRVRTGF